MNERWLNINEVFPEGGTFLEDEWFSNEDIKNNLELTEIHSYTMKPIRRMIEKEWEIIWYDNGNMDFNQTYSVFPRDNIDNIPLLNAYGSKVLSNYIENKFSDNGVLNDNEEDFELDYSSL